MLKRFLIPLFFAFLFLGAVFSFLNRESEETQLKLKPEKTVVTEVAVLSFWKPVYWNHHSVHQLLLKRTRLKSGVYVGRLHPAMDTAALEVVAIFHEVAGDEYKPLITSGNDFPGHYMASKHYENKALDFRTKDLTRVQKQRLFQRAKEKLTPRFTVLFEDSGLVNEHLHFHLNTN
ncbi:MAG: hypothetical protein LBR60_08215 [Fibrobacter sp.]|jgi:hypothetical protein|nr:hypothetical protein [Fibrobacter sp.]